VFMKLILLGLSFWYGAKLVVRGEITGSSVLVVFLALIIGTTSLIMLPQSLMAIAQVEGKRDREENSD
jgi:hypothetical protein